MDLAKSMAVVDHRLVVPMPMRVVVSVVVTVTVIPRVGIRPANAVARLAGFAHGERGKIALHPQHP